MNRIHRRACSSAKWFASVERSLPAMLDRAGLGDDVLEIGPGYGATTRVLAKRAARLTAIEVERDSAARLAEQFAGTATIVSGSGADMPFDSGSFSGVACFTMLHHVPSAELQDQLFAEACRVLRPGGMFAGFDGQLSLRFRLLHVGDTMTVVEPETFPDRLRRAGFTEVRTELDPGRRLTFFATK